MERPYKRSFFRITDSKFQRDFVALCVFIAAMSSLIVLTGAWFVSEDYRSFISEVSETLGQTFKLEAGNRVSDVWLTMVLACLVNVVTVGLLAFAFSTRVSGILFRIQHELNSLADGEQPRKIKPRDNDFFPELVAAANRLFKD